MVDGGGVLSFYRGNPPNILLHLCQENKSKLMNNYLKNTIIK